MTRKNYSFLEILRGFDEFSNLTSDEVKDMRWSLKERVYKKIFCQLPGCQQASQELLDLLLERSAHRSTQSTGSGQGKSASEFRAQFCAIVAAELTRLNAPRGCCSVPRLLTDKEANCKAFGFLCARFHSFQKQGTGAARRRSITADGASNELNFEKTPHQPRREVPVSAPAQLESGSGKESIRHRPEWVGVGEIEDFSGFDLQIGQPSDQKEKKRKPPPKKPWVGLDLTASGDSESEEEPNPSSPAHQISAGRGTGVSHRTTLSGAGMESGTVSRPKQHDQIDESNIEEIVSLKRENASLKRRLEEVECAYNAVMVECPKPKSKDFSTVIHTQGQIIKLKNSLIAQLQRQLKMLSDALDGLSQIFDDAESVMMGEQRQKLKELRRTARHAAHTKMHFSQNEDAFLTSSDRKPYHQLRPSQIATVRRVPPSELEINPALLENVACIAHLEPKSVKNLEASLAKLVSDLVQFAVKLKSIHLQKQSTDQKPGRIEDVYSQLPLSIWEETQALCEQVIAISHEVACFQALADSEKLIQSQGIPNASALVKGSVQKLREGRLKLLKVLTKMEADRCEALNQKKVFEAESRAWRPLVPLLLQAFTSFYEEAQVLFNDFTAQSRDNLAEPLCKVIKEFELLQSSPKYSSFLKGSADVELASFFMTAEAYMDSLKAGLDFIDASVGVQKTKFSSVQEILSSILSEISSKIPSPSSI